MALACDPDLLVLDEPTTGLDVTTQEQILDLLTELRARIGLAMLYVTHDLALLSQIADRIGVMYAGRMVEVAPTRETLPRAEASLHPRSDRVDPAASKAPTCGRRCAGCCAAQELPPGCPFAPRCDYARSAALLSRSNWRPSLPKAPSPAGAGARSCPNVAQIETEERRSCAGGRAGAGG